LLSHSPAPPPSSDTETFVMLLSTVVPESLAPTYVAIPAFSGARTHFSQIYYDGDAKNKNTPVRKMYKASGPAFYLPKDYKNAR
jgi:hypothetical protein